MSQYEKHLTVPRIRRRRARAAVSAVLTAALVGAGGAVADADGPVDLRSLDVRDASAATPPPQSTVDLRSPDARDAGRAVPPSTPRTFSDLRSPDVRDGGPARSVAPAPVGDAGGLDWEVGVAGGGMLAVLLGLGGLTLVARRRSTAGRSAAV